VFWDFAAACHNALARLEAHRSSYSRPLGESADHVAGASVIWNLRLDNPGRRPLLIIRVFRARIHPGKEGEFERFVRDTGVPMVEAQAGCSHVSWGRSPLE
jgi:hypothetical protein